MFDHVKIDDLYVSADFLLDDHPHLKFLLPVDEQTGEVPPEHRTDTYRGITFTLRPQRGYRGHRRYNVQMKGSIHKASNGGLHNGNDFTVSGVATTLDELVQTFRIDPFNSRLNNVEFGVNVVLPFPADRVLKALICYKNKPFKPEVEDGKQYYQCKSQRYIVKIYNKGLHYGLPDEVLRFEIKVIRMEHLTANAIKLHTLADLLSTHIYPALGQMLRETFADILFDEPDINKTSVPAGKERELLLEGRRHQHWALPKLTPENRREYDRHHKQLSREEKRFRALLQKYRPGEDWQQQTADLISGKWQQLTAITPALQAAIDRRVEHWKTVLSTDPKCPKLTGLFQGEMSKINTLSTGLFFDTLPLSPNVDISRGTSGVEGSTSSTLAAMSAAAISSTSSTAAAAASGVRCCVVTGYALSENQRTGTKLGIVTLREKSDVLQELVSRHSKGRRKRKQHDEAYYQAHNVRNALSNPRNHLRRRVLRAIEQSPLFNPCDVIRLRPEEQEMLRYYEGTPYDLGIC
ncbi:hypothetical protein GCM10023187_55450 [Nibrella viscosa]|uniref:Uncharacterized protein n=1 Tax=Nibrella viscosa TaxID=1084524 RepID=A0ABP8L2C5_9BACT